ncbi:hypothetical protein HAHE_04590 [Haloferula helveola]|uniref:Sigma-70 family RNA polymerase sigma factor n=1 Tax=Haloferula helveola TaxID=490095 RepID=A0ABM7RCX4_9BACT|nr:hypothetical protein HAHE_04590 [Haloferula helveola]
MSELRPFLQACWRACCQRARRPVEGVLVEKSLAVSVAERALRNAAIDAEDPSQPKFLAAALEETGRHASGTVAAERTSSADPQRHHDPADPRYPENLDLDRLQRHDADRGFHDSEWNQLPSLLRPLAYAQLAKKDIRPPDAEDLFLEILTELARPRGSDNRAPITDLTVFEEIVPYQSRMLQFRSIDFHRRRSALRNQTNTGPSLDALADDPDRPMQFADPGTEGGAPPRFEEIYAQCEEALEPDEWRLVFDLYVAQSVTIQDLVDDPEFTDTLGLKSGASASTRRRAINARIETALEKLRDCLLP